MSQLDDMVEIVAKLEKENLELKERIDLMHGEIHHESEFDLCPSIYCMALREKWTKQGVYPFKEREVN